MQYLNFEIHQWMDGEILEDCDGSVELAQTKSQTKNVYKYWKFKASKVSLLQYIPRNINQIQINTEQNCLRVSSQFWRPMVYEIWTNQTLEVATRSAKEHIFNRDDAKTSCRLSNKKTQPVQQRPTNSAVKRPTDNMFYLHLLYYYN